MHTHHQININKAIFFILLAFSLSACTIPQLNLPDILSPSQTNTPISNNDQSLPGVEIQFRVQIPSSSPKDQAVYLKVMEEVTGLAFNAQRFEMQRESDQFFTYTLSVPIGTVLKYRYSRSANSIEVQEHISDNRQVRYRMYVVTAPAVIEDVVSRWTDTQFIGATGRINGHVLDSITQQPIPNILIVCGGVQTLTSSDGSFLIEGLLPGVHNLVAYALDGTYQTFQQGARVAADSTTPAEIRLSAAKLVGVVFTAKVPASTIPAVPIRIAGNLYQLGNVFADLPGGVSTVSTRMPVLSLLPDGRYSLTLALPAGADIHYTYTLGDGFWNTEVDENGAQKIRQFIVPSQDTLIEDEILSWNVKNSAPISFDITVPANTPKDDYVSIQFRPIFGWTEPIPMWKLGENRWGFILNNPLSFVDNLHYRFCRNNQCGQADAAETQGTDNTGMPVNTSLFAQSIKDEVTAWAWYDESGEPIEITTSEVQPREYGFFAGVEYQPIYDPSYNAQISFMLDDIQQLSANWLLLTPTWTYTRQSPPVLEILPGHDPLWLDMSLWLRQITERGISVAIFPQPSFSVPVSEWWLSSTRDFSWWQVWFERYRNFALYHADLAAKNNANALILGGDWLSPAYPNGTLSDNAPSGVPADSETRWRMLIQEIKTHFNGPIFWAITPEQAQNNPPKFLDSVDAIYLLWSEPIISAESLASDINTMTQYTGQKLDQIAAPLNKNFQKAIILGAFYPSATGAATGCINGADGNCIEWEKLSQPYQDDANIQIALQEQVNIYNVLLGAVNTRPWISGFVSRGYYPPAALLDKSASIHGKPTAELLSYWFSSLLAEEEE